VRVVIAVLLLSSIASAAPQTFVSGATRTHVIELFTSEGCSSCPPADAWLSGLRDDPRLWHDVIPIAWHVDYWDRLGWKDRFASKAGTQREYAYGAKWKEPSVYTPCVVIDGLEARMRAFPAPSSALAGALRATCDGRQVQVQFEPVATGDFDVHAVRLALGVISKVGAGENGGRTLRHDFIASGAMATARLTHGAASLDLPSAIEDGAEQHALAVWITRHGELAPIQAVGGLLANQ